MCVYVCVCMCVWSVCECAVTFGCLDAEALLCLGQHELHECGGGLGREVRGRGCLEVSKHLLLEQLERPCRSLTQMQWWRG